MRSLRFILWLFICCFVMHTFVTNPHIPQVLGMQAEQRRVCCQVDPGSECCKGRKGGPNPPLTDPRKRLSQIVKRYHLDTPQNITPGDAQAIPELQKLQRNNSIKAEVLKYLGVTYLYTKQDSKLAISHLKQAIELGNSIMFEIKHSEGWNKPGRKGSELVWKNAVAGQLEISSGEAAISEAGNKYIYSKSEIAGIESQEGPTVILMKYTSIKSGQSPEPLWFGVKTQAEAETIIELVKGQAQARK